jgi:flagellar biosynthetic protein FliP
VNAIMAAPCPTSTSSPRCAGLQRLSRSVSTAFGAFGIVGLTATAALAQGSAPAGVTGVPGLDALLPPGNGAASGRIIQLVALLTVLSLAPGLLVMVTSFTRFAVAFSFLRSGLGLQSTPANLFLVSLALFMTFYVMAPTFDRAWNEGVKPLQENRIGEEEALAKIVEPFREFMTQHVRPKDLQTFTDLASRNFPKAKAGDKIDLRILIPAFMISELRRGFEIGFLIVLPFLVIDIIVSTIVMSMGMMMLPPTVISLPFKVLFFILIDGWNLLVSGLVRSFF